MSKSNQAGNPETANLNQGVDYMAQQQPAANQPIVNTEALKAQAGQVAGKAQAGLNNIVGKVKTDKKYLVGAIVIAVVVVVLLLSVVVKFLAPGSGVVRAYTSGLKKMNAEKIVKVMHKDFYDDKGDEVDSWEERFEDMEDDDQRYVSFKIRECEKHSEDEVEDIAKMLESYYDIDEDDVTAARTYYVRAKFDDDGEKNLSYMSVTVVKIDGKWYLYR